MRLFVAVTDNDWFAFHASKYEVDEVNFWRPSPDATFKVLQPGEILLFKLHAPDNFIAGGGFFTRLLQLPVNLAWDTFGEANGVRSQLKCGAASHTIDTSHSRAWTTPPSAASCLWNRSSCLAPSGFRARLISS